MNSAIADRIVLIGGVGPEIVAALLVLLVAVAGTVAGIAMARRGRPEAWSLPGLFGLLIIAALVMLVHLPTRLSLDARGIEVRFWTLRQIYRWDAVAQVDLTRGWFGSWLRVVRSDGKGSRVPQSPAGYLIRTPPVELRELAMRIEAWRFAAQR